MSDFEESPAPANPLHRMPEFINRHEPAVEMIQRRGHLLPSEWDVRFDKNNQPLPDNDKKA
jgi:hypothetical protein